MPKRSANGFTHGYFASVLLRAGEVCMSHTYCSDAQRPALCSYVGRCMIAQTARVLITCAICNNPLSGDPVNIETLAVVRPTNLKKV